MVYIIRKKIKNIEGYDLMKNLAEEYDSTVNAVRMRKNRNPLVVWTKDIDEDNNEKILISKESWYVYQRTAAKIDQKVPIDRITFNTIASLMEEFALSEGKLHELCKTIAPWYDAPVILDAQYYTLRDYGRFLKIYHIGVSDVLRIIKYLDLTRSYFSEKSKEKRNWEIMPYKEYSYENMLVFDVTEERAFQWVRFFKEVACHTLANLKCNGFVYTHNNLWDLIRDDIKMGTDFELRVCSQYPDFSFDVVKHFVDNKFDLKDFYF